MSMSVQGWGWGSYEWGLVCFKVSSVGRLCFWTPKWLTLLGCRLVLSVPRRAGAVGSRNDFSHREGWEGCLLPGLKGWENSQAMWQILLHRCSGQVGKTHLSLSKPFWVEHSEQGFAWRAGCQWQRWMGPSHSRLKFLISLPACLRLPSVSLASSMS